MPNKRVYGIYGYGTIPVNLEDYVPFIDGWIIQTNWRALEPSPNVYAWSQIQPDIEFVHSLGLNVGIQMVSNPSPYYPLWLAQSTFNVPIVNVTNPANTYAYYLDTNGKFKSRLFKMLDALFAFISSIAVDNNILFYQSAEGHQDLPVPYLGIPPNQFKITAAQFEMYQKSIWTHSYSQVETIDLNGDVTQVFDLLLNAANSWDLKDYIIQQLPYAWVKVQRDGQDYGYNLELNDWDKIILEKQIVKANPGQFRKRSDLTITPNRTWFKQAYNMNMLQVIAHALTKSVDVLGINPVDLPNLSTAANITDLFNDLAGHDSGLGATKQGYYFVNGKIDGANIARFPVSQFGHVLTGGLDSSTNPLDYITKANMTRLANIKTNIGNGCMLDTTQFGPNAGGDTRYDDKFNNDVGMKVREGPLARFVTQPDWLREIKNFYRIGSHATDSWGRYAAGFESATVHALGSEFFFKLDDEFKANTYGITVRIFYLNVGTEHWGIRSVTGSLILEVTNGNTNEWTYVDVSIPVTATGGLTNHAGDVCDFAFEHVSGTLSWKLGGYRISKQQSINALPIVSIGVARQTTSTTVAMVATASDSDGTITKYSWFYTNGPNGEPPYPDGANPLISAATSASTNLTALTINGDYYIACRVTDDRNGTASTSVKITKVSSIVKPTAHAGPDKVAIVGDTVVIGEADTAVAGHAIVSRLWTLSSKPLGAPDPTFVDSTVTTSVSGLTFVGDYIFYKTVTDDQPQTSDPDYVTITINPDTTNQPPIVDAGADNQQTGTTATLLGTATDSDGSIAQVKWENWDTNTAVTPALATPNAASCAVSGMSAIGWYKFRFGARDDQGLWAYDYRIITRVTTVLKPTADAGPDQFVTKPDTSANIGGTDMATGGFSIATRAYTVVSKPAGAADPTFSTPTLAHTDVNGLTSLGPYVIGKTATDTRSPPQTSDRNDVTLTVQNAQSTTTKFSAFFRTLDVNQKLAAMDNLHINIIRTTAIARNWSNPAHEKFLIKLRNNQKKALLNINHISAAGSNPLHFPVGNELNLYLEGLDAICAAFSDVIECVVVENEPLTANFYDENDPIENYIAQVTAAIPVAQSHGCKITCGAVHVPYQLTVKAHEQNGTLGSLTGKELKAKKIIWAYATDWADIDYVNTHSAVGGSDNQAGLGRTDDPDDWKNAFAYMHLKSGKPAMCNEVGFHSTNTDLITTILSQHANSHIVYSTIYAGEPNNTDDALNITGTAASPFPSPVPNAMGLAFRAVVDAFS